MAKARKPWSKVSLHRHLLNLLDRPLVTIKRVPKRNDTAGSCDFDDFYPPRWIKIEVDANAGDPWLTVLHELIHVVFSELIWGKFDPTLEEVMILAFEHYMQDFIKKSPQRLAKWTKIIDRKIAESEALLPDRPLAELAERPPEK